MAMMNARSKKRFATDTEYYREEKVEERCNLVEWQDDTGGVTLEAPNANNAGWSADEMFNRNKSLGVKSTFKGDLSQYTTCHAKGTREERARAEKMARDIERTSKNKHLVLLENDDEERDLDKETVVEPVKVNPVKEKKFQFNPNAPSFTPSQQTAACKLNLNLPMETEPYIPPPPIPVYFMPTNMPGMGMGMPTPLMFYDPQLMNVPTGMHMPQMMTSGILPYY